MTVDDAIDLFEAESLQDPYPLYQRLRAAGAVRRISASEFYAATSWDAVAEAIATSQAASPQVIRNTRRMVAADHEQNIVFSAALRLKDVEYGLRFARKIGIGSPFGALAEGIYCQLCELGHAHVNESKVIDVARHTHD